MTGLRHQGESLTNRRHVGGKAARLAELSAQGLPVPRFVVVPASAIGGSEGDALVEAFLDTCIPNNSFAVRSSAVGEDGAGASHAGQFETVLAVVPDSVAQTVRRVAASACRETAALYRERRRLGAAPLPMAVVIQVMVDARASGVAFTHDPVSGAPGPVVVAGLGLGVGVVDDRVPADTYRRPFGALAWEPTVALKSERIVASDGAVRVENVTADEAGRPALSPSELEGLGEALDQIASGALEPQDVEWVIDKMGRLWILQARPITALPEPPLEVWEDSNVGENYPGFTRPLSYSLARRTYQQLFSRAMLEVGLPPAVVAESRTSLGRLLGLIRGRLYLNLTSYYAMFDSVPGLERTVGAWQSAFGIANQADPERASGHSPFVLRLRRAVTWIRLARRYLTNDRQVAACLESTERIVAETRRERLGPGSVAILDAWSRLETALLPGWTAIIFDDLFLFLLLDRLERRIGGDCGTLLAGAGGHAMSSLAAVRSLRALADRALAVPGARELLERRERDQLLWNELLRLDREGGFRRAAEEYLERNGDRAIGELKLETLTPAETPWVLVPALRSAATATFSPPTRRPPVAPRPREGPFTRLATQWLLARCRRLIAHRENLSHARARAYGAIRRMVRPLGNTLANEGHLDEPDQVFDLLLEELHEFAAGRIPPGELAGLARCRARRYARWAGMPRPSSQVILGTAGPPAPTTFSADGDLRGIPCSSGVAAGPVRIILEPAGGEDVSKAILVAPVTELGWMPLLLQARGLIVERGSMLSHAAIIARELGLPAIVGVPGATTRLRDGDLVEMDGATGRIAIRGRG